MDSERATCRLLEMSSMIYFSHRVGRERPRLRDLNAHQHNWQNWKSGQAKYWVMSAHNLTWESHAAWTTMIISNRAQAHKCESCSAYKCDRIWENPPYGIRAQFAQCAFLVAKVEICQSPDFVIYVSNNPSSNCCRRLWRLVVHTKAK